MTIVSTSEHNHDYSGLLTHVVVSFNAVVKSHGQLFVTSADSAELWSTYLDSFPSQLRQLHNCHACRRFIEQYGSLAFVDADGNLSSLFWTGGAAEPYTSGFSAMARLIRRAKIESPFYTKKTIWGTPVTTKGDIWSHFSVSPPKGMVYHDPILSAGQQMAAMKERYRTVMSFLPDYKPEHLDVALALMQGEFLARSEKFLAPLKWLRSLYDAPKGTQGKNLRWVMITEAPEGYCHPRAGVIGELLSDIAKGLDMKFVKKNFDAKLDPVKYQQAQAAPTTGNIQAAEKIIEQLGFAPSLERRFARLEEVQLEWSPKDSPTKEASGGVFGHLKPKDVEKPRESMDLAAVTITWAKFSRTVLPEAVQIKARTPHMGNYTAILTANDPEAPVIMKWGNPFSMYVYDKGSPRDQWGLRGQDWSDVTGITRLPQEWGGNPQEHYGRGLIFVLRGAVDSREISGNALFMDNLDSRLHQVRSTIAAYSKKAKIHGRSEASACGLSFHEKSTISVRVLVHGLWTDYVIDRWE